MLKVLHINSTDSIVEVGGMARLLHNHLPEHGIESSLFVYQQSDIATGIYSLRAEENAWHNELIEKSRTLHMPELYAPHLMNLLKTPEFAAADVVHLHGTGEYFSYLLLPFLTAKPLVWTLYDCRPYTGGCTHSAHCQQWAKGECAECPIDKRQQNEARRSLLYRLKRDIYQTVDMSIVSVNKWQQEQVKDSILKGQTLENIPLAVDTRIFHPGDKEWFRQELALPLDYFIMVYDCRQGGLQECGGQQLRQILALMEGKHSKLMLVSIGADVTNYFAGLSIESKSLVKDIDSGVVADYFRASDVLLHLQPLDHTCLTIMQAAACTLPAIVFDLGAMTGAVIHEQTGYIAELGNIPAFAGGIEYLIENTAKRQQMGKQASELVGEKNRLKVVLKQYVDLYKKLVPAFKLEPITIALQGNNRYEALQTVATKAAQEAWGNDEQFDKKQSNKQARWGQIWQKLEQSIVLFGDDKQYKGFFVDAYCLQCLSYIADVSLAELKLSGDKTVGDSSKSVMKKNTANPQSESLRLDKEEIWELVRRWLEYRALEPRAGHLLPEEKALQAKFCRELRNLLVRYFTTTTLEQFVQVRPYYQETMFRLWRWVFLNSMSALHVDMTNESIDINLLKAEEAQTGYPKLLLQSMFIPHPKNNGGIDIVSLMQARLPISMKMIVLLWLTNTPLYNGTLDNRDVVVKTIKDFCNYATVNLASKLPEGVIQICLEHFTSSLWRVSYLGGNNIEALSAYGDFVRKMTLRNFLAYEKKRKTKGRKKAKLRVGYLSTNFRTQAVSFYMANRILEHDAEEFEIYTFALKRYEDDITQKIKQASDHVFEYTDFKNLEPIIKDICASELDILIYADIGMDTITYQLGSLRLAPVQAVLVGHGVTTGVANIDYYISGDFEPVDAQKHYREKLIRLPNLGAAQLAPLVKKSGITRKFIGVPDDAVILMSCANGIKYNIERDILFVEILKQAPEAFIVLKPFQNPNGIDEHLSERIMNLARKHGVAERLIILPPLANPADLWGLLVLADIQLDTYPYGGWTTNMEALYAGLPIVTQEGDMARSRWGAAMLRALDISEGIAYNDDEYVKWAVKLVKDRELRLQVQTKIKTSVEPVLFNGKQAQGDYEDMLLTIARV